MISYKEGLIMYWCEGDKSEPYGVNLTTADAKMNLLFKEWLQHYYNVPDEKISLRLHLWPDSDIKTAEKWWSKKLGLKYFTKPYIKKVSGKNKKYPNGICRVGTSSKVIKSDIMSNIHKLF